MPTLDKAYNLEIHSKFLRSLMNDDGNFIANKIAPTLSVKKDQGQLLNYGKQGMRIVHSGRAVGGRYKRIDFDVEKTNSWNLQDHGLFGYVFGEEIDNSESVINAEQDKLKLIDQIMKLNFEDALASQITAWNISNNATLAGNDQWSDYTNSDPIQEIETQKETIRQATGKLPNSIAMGRQVFVQLKRHPDVLELIKYSTVVTDQMLEEIVLRDILGFENIAIGSSVYNDANLEGTENMTDIWGKKCLMYYSAPSIGLHTDTFAVTARRNTASDPIAGSFATSEEQKATANIESGVVVSNKYDILLVNTDLAYLWLDAVA